ncbi:hypothetical protein [Mycolicibacterium vaccae]|uniref:hypothetical protein n=1 Tax=Mycolicibacterium vaccae TaxID=1810 RepID=UPI003CFDC06B
MNIVSAATRAVTKTADMTTAAAGAIGGAAVNGAVGAVRGAASGVRSGLDNGSRSSAAAALTLGAVGAVGLVEWPVLLAVGGTALALHQLSHRGEHASDGTPAARPVATVTPRRATKSTARARSRPAKKAASSRRPTTK